MQLLQIGPDDHSVGLADAPITLLEYGSYDCSHCRNAAQTVSALQAEFDGRLRRVFRHFPRVTIHSLSALAAEAAEAAATQGKFWQMHEALLARRDTASEGALLACAAAVGLDLPRFLSDLEGGVHRARVGRDLQSGVSSGVVSTPTFFLNGIRHDDVADIDVLRATITDCLSPTNVASGNILSRFATPDNASKPFGEGFTPAPSRYAAETEGRRGN